MTRRQFTGNEENVTNRTAPNEQRTTTATVGQQSQGSSTLDQAKQKGGQAVDQVEQKASQLADQAKHEATSQIASQKQHASDSLGSVAQALRQTGEQLREQDQRMIAQYTDKAAEQLDRFSRSLGSKDINQLLGEAERYARREPALFLGGAFLVGLLGARFLKSSSQSEQSSSDGSPSLGRRANPQAYQYQREHPEYTRVEQTPNYGPGTRSGPASNVGGTTLDTASRHAPAIRPEPGRGTEDQ